MFYNLKITNYVDDVQVNYYRSGIGRRIEDDKDDFENDEQLTQSVKQDNIISLPLTWYNSKSGKVEIVPRGFQVIENPFNKGEQILYPEERFIEPGMEISLNYEDMIDFVNEKLMEEAERSQFANKMRTLRRTKNALYSLARANEWTLFVTFTFMDERVRDDFDLAKKYISKRIMNVKNQYNLCFKYLLIPEQDKNGNWHFHGLFKDIKGLKLERAINPHNNKPIKVDNVQVYNMPQFACLGHNTATFVQNNAKVTRYILKYITKEMEIRFPGKRKYLCSKGLSRGDVVTFEISSEEEIGEKLQEVYAYDLTLVSEKQVINPYDDSLIKYKQFKK